MLKCITATFVGQEVGQIQWRGSFKRLVSGDSISMKLTLDIEERLGKTKKNVTWDKVGFTQVKRIKQLFWAQLEEAIVTKQHFSKKE